ncbi:MAG: NusG domain II-containing protein [Oscillospiraceae bacterium]|nr:NusG domain II-containing protein [Oscillospiraceae bacterium]
MQKRERRFFSLPLLTTLSVLLFCSLLITFLLPYVTEQGTVAEIWVDDRLVRQVDLVSAEEEVFSPCEGVEIAIREQTIGFVSSDCPDQTCVHSGMLSKKGEVAICLPKGVRILLVAGKDEIDAML